MASPREGRCASSCAWSKRVRAMRTPGSSTVTDSVSDGMTEKDALRGRGQRHGAPGVVRNGERQWIRTVGRRTGDQQRENGGEGEKRCRPDSNVHRFPSLEGWCKAGGSRVSWLEATTLAFPGHQRSVTAVRHIRLRQPCPQRNPQWLSNASCRIRSGIRASYSGGAASASDRLPVAPSLQRATII